MAERSNSNSDPIRGWLVLVVICWFFTPIQAALLLFDLYTNVLSNGAWRELTRPGSEFYSALWAPALILGVLGNLVISISAIFALILLLKRSKYAPITAMAWFTMNFLLVGADYAIASRLPGFDDEPFGDFDAVKELVMAGLMAVVWIPYFILSERVKATFTREWPRACADFCVNGVLVTAEGAAPRTGS